jgi:hypothetical protein
MRVAFSAKYGNVISEVLSESVTILIDGYTGMYQYTCHVICDVVWVRYEKNDLFPWHLYFLTDAESVLFELLELYWSGIKEII